MALDMDPGIRAQWTAALRSGNYKQGQRNLRKNNQFCCLGVLCDLAAADGIVEVTPASEGDGIWDYGGDIGVLPHVVWEWAGLDDSSPMVYMDGRACELTVLNDEDDYDFAKIADAIDGGVS